MQGTSDEIQYVGMFHPWDVFVRCLTITDVLEILRRTPRPFGKTTACLAEEDLLVIDEIPKATGCIIVSQRGDSGHVVSLYRCRGGLYVYYDSEGAEPVKGVVMYLLRCGVPMEDLFCISQGQYFPYQTCAYHAIMFFDYVSSQTTWSSMKLIKGFENLIWNDSDHKAIKVVRSILQEFESNMKIYKEYSVMSSVLPFFQSARLRHRQIATGSHRRMKTLQIRSM